MDTQNTSTLSDKFEKAAGALGYVAAACTGITITALGICGLTIAFDVAKETIGQPVWYIGTGAFGTSVVSGGLALTSAIASALTDRPSVQNTPN